MIDSAERHDGSMSADNTPAEAADEHQLAGQANPSSLPPTAPMPTDHPGARFVMDEENSAQDTELLLTGEPVFGSTTQDVDFLPATAVFDLDDVAPHTTTNELDSPAPTRYMPVQPAPLHPQPRATPPVQLPPAAMPAAAPYRAQPPSAPPLPVRYENYTPPPLAPQKPPHPQQMVRVPGAYPYANPYPPMPAHNAMVPIPYAPRPMTPMGYAPYGVDPKSGMPYSSKSKTTSGLLQIFLGGLGVGRFYSGHVGIAIAQVLLTLFTGGIGGLWGFIDGIVILAGDPRDSNSLPLR